MFKVGRPLAGRMKGSVPPVQPGSMPASPPSTGEAVMPAPSSPLEPAAPPSTHPSEGAAPTAASEPAGTVQPATPSPSTEPAPATMVAAPRPSAEPGAPIVVAAPVAVQFDPIPRVNEITSRPMAAVAPVPAVPQAMAIGTLGAGGWIPTLEPAPADIRLGRLTRPWRTVWSTILQVFVVFILAQAAAVAVLLPVSAAISGDLEFGIGGGMVGFICSLMAVPGALLILWLRRPQLVHVQLVRPDPEGAHLHALHDGGQLATPTPSRFSHHLLLDQSQLEVPRARILWALFVGVLALSSALVVGLWLRPDDLSLILLAVFVGIWAWLAGFSLPVFAWWSMSLRLLGVPTERRHGESAMLAGMLATVPAIVINSTAALLLTALALSDQLTEGITATAVAPIAEESFKALAVWMQRHQLKSVRHGFLYGATVGLGFAIVENLSYILLSFGGGLPGFTLTAFVRGIGSIPGHALWTGLTGIGIAAMWQRMRRDPAQASASEPDASTPWVLIQPQGGGSFVEVPAPWQRQTERPVTQHPLPLPRTLATALPLAMLGHALWNGTSIAVSWFASRLSDDLVLQLAIQLAWIAVLISTLLVFGWRLLESVRAVPLGGHLHPRQVDP